MHEFFALYSISYGECKAGMINHLLENPAICEQRISNQTIHNDRGS